jgi:hypothetical protein
MTPSAGERIRLSGSRRLETFPVRAAPADAIPKLHLLAVLSGALAAAVIITFRSLIELGQNAFLPHYYDYESLSPAWRLFLLRVSLDCLVRLCRLRAGGPENCISRRTQHLQSPHPQTRITCLQ